MPGYCRCSPARRSRSDCGVAHLFRARDKASPCLHDVCANTKLSKFTCLLLIAQIMNPAVTGRLRKLRFIQWFLKSEYEAVSQAILNRRESSRIATPSRSGDRQQGALFVERG